MPQTRQPIEVYCSRSSLLFGMVICLVVVLALALVTFASLTF